MNPTTCEEPAQPFASGETGAAKEVILADGSRIDVSKLSLEELRTLHWEQDRDFAARILAAPKGSEERTEAVRQAYGTVPIIFAQKQLAAGTKDTLGMKPRHAILVLKLLERQKRQNIEPSFFEIGFGAGELLKSVINHGCPAAGVEASQCLRDQAVALLGPQHAERLVVADLLTHNPAHQADPYTLIYWNDVFEHIPPDEIQDYLAKIFDMLAPGGSLVTITPNWHNRPSDATAIHHPPRTEARGLHLKEYTLSQVTALLRRAGFNRVEVPLFLTHNNIHLHGTGLARTKRLLEPTLEWMPFRLAQIICRGFGLYCTIATKKR
ncbi:MAG: methyltransferase domain-containing protein [Planctomycetota bacterium]|nr:methyltransferase domain-containing protein [Planctomycetota bacterium]